MWITFRRASGALAITALCAVPVLGQQRTEEQPKTAASKPNGAVTQPPVRNGNRAPAGNAQESNRLLQRTANKPVTTDSTADTDQLIAGMLALCNEEEAIVGKFAAEHAEDERVQKFATMMTKEHSQMAKQLQKWSPEARLMNDGDQAVDGKAGSNRKESFDPLTVHQQIANRSIKSSEKMLGSKKGADFDMAYLGSQCVLHQQMIDKASVLREYASSDLQSAIDKGIESAQDHLAHVQDLIEKLAKADRK